MSNTTHLEACSLKLRGNLLLRSLAASCILFALVSTAEAFDSADLERLKETGSCEECDLRGADLVNADLTGANLRRAILTGADLKGANMTGANLQAANLINADLFSTTLTNADLRRAKLINADLWTSNVKGAQFADSDLTNPIYSPV